MFSTQLTGLFNRVLNKNEYGFEDGARLLAQASISSSTIYLFASKETYGVISEALHSLEPLKHAKEWNEELHFDEITEGDRFLLLSRYSTDTEVVELAKKLCKHNIPFVGISTTLDSDVEDLSKLADVHIELGLTKGLLPDEEGNRFGYPASLAALFAYYGLRFTMEEILEEY
ncbi:DUF2529 family protein [Bacillus sp. 03113]|uniref:DUF2529 family protein n=1 Tax=Bacillus sp. 03113 TaxID=2578211 RepID=UPI002852E95D|nr:DUF2529 family protein [Bacillus sp. 03113]